jgi:excisionase family DNA binding protein
MEPRPPSARPTFYTVQEAAEILRMSENHIRAGIRRGEIPGRKVGGSYRVSARFFDDDSQQANSAPSAQRSAPNSPWS